MLSRVDEWTYDMFELSEASGGRPLSMLAFALFKRSGIVGLLMLDEPKLARWVVEEGVGVLTVDAPKPAMRAMGGLARLPIRKCEAEKRRPAGEGGRLMMKVVEGSVGVSSDSSNIPILCCPDVHLLLLTT